MNQENKNELREKVKQLQIKILEYQQLTTDLMREHDAYVLLLSIGEPIQYKEGNLNENGAV